MMAKKMVFSMLLTALLLTGYATAALAEDPATRVGTITAVAKSGAAIIVNVEVMSETAQPLNPQLSTGTPEPSSVMDPGATKAVEIASQKGRFTIWSMVDALTLLPAICYNRHS